MTLFRNLCILQKNLRNIVRGREHRFSYSKALDLYVCEDGGTRHYFANRKRGFSLYRKGLSSRAMRLGASYCIDSISFSNSSVVIDCGANYGDLWRYLEDKIDPKNYITFEPGSEEFRSISNNAPHGRHFNIALGDRIGTQTFYVDHKEADSSLIEPQTYEGTETCEVTTLDAFVTKYKVPYITLLKLEAEGFEPEILVGAKETLRHIQYIAVDGGYERGKSCTETFTAVANYLFTFKFELVATNWSTHRALFRNSRYPEGMRN